MPLRRGRRHSPQRPSAASEGRHSATTSLPRAALPDLRRGASPPRFSRARPVCWEPWWRVPSGTGFTLVGLAAMHRRTREKSRARLILFSAYGAIFLLTFPLLAFWSSACSTRPAPGGPIFFANLTTYQRKKTMEVILLERIARLGGLGDTVRVRERLCPQLPPPDRSRAPRQRGEPRQVRVAEGLAHRPQRRASFGSPERLPISSTACAS